MKLAHIVYSFVIALAALALIAQGASAATTTGTSKSNNLKITVATDGKDCATKGGALITNKDGSKTCTMPTNCKPIASATTATNRCPVGKSTNGGVTTTSEPPGSRCCCMNCQSSSLPRCSFCS